MLRHPTIKYNNNKYDTKIIRTMPGGYLKIQIAGKMFIVKANQIIFRKENTEKCQSFIRHGPGHQSKTFCRLKGEHKIHENYYGANEQFAKWRGKKAFSDYFDEPIEL